MSINEAFVLDTIQGAMYRDMERMRKGLMASDGMGELEDAVKDLSLSITSYSKLAQEEKEKGECSEDAATRNYHLARAGAFETAERWSRKTLAKLLSAKTKIADGLGSTHGDS